MISWPEYDLSGLGTGGALSLVMAAPPLVGPVAIAVASVVAIAVAAVVGTSVAAIAVGTSVAAIAVGLAAGALVGVSVPPPPHDASKSTIATRTGTALSFFRIIVLSSI